MQCPKQTRRLRLLTALATGAWLAAGGSAAAQEDRPGSDARLQKGDLLVLAEGDHEGEVIKPGDLTVGGPPVLARSKDPKTSVIRKGARLHEMLVIRLDPGELDEQTRSRPADGIVAYSAVFTHAVFPVTGWLKAEQGDKDVLKCFCHNSEFNPRGSAQAVFGLAPRRLAALPLAVADGSLIVPATSVGKVGAQHPG